MAEIIGRQKETKLLDSLLGKDSSSFVAVYGRRRVGKTFLIRSVFEEKFTFHVTGMANVNKRDQLVNFHATMVRYFPEMENKPVPESWFYAFQNLITALEKLPKTGKKVLFFDELPWMDAPNSLFVSSIEHFWNSWASARTDIVLIGCGSAASWMVNQLIRNTGGLYNRVTHLLRIEPFTLGECQLYFAAKNAPYDQYQLLQLYMVLGGIPYYLSLVEPEKSAVQNINDLCFSTLGKLRHEFDLLFHSLFQKAERHIAIIEALATKTKGMGRKELLQTAKLSDGGNTSTVLNELEESQFIRQYHAFGKRKNSGIYQLTDFFSLFHLRYIRPNSDFDEDFWINGMDNPAIRAWSGYAFEQVCLAHLPQLKKALGIASVQTRTSAWEGSDGQQNAQIDLVIDRRDQVINLCEMKFSIRPFTITKAYAESLRNKLGIFREATKTNKALWLTFITTYGLQNNNHAQSLVRQSLDMEVLFSLQK